MRFIVPPGRDALIFTWSVCEGAIPDTRRSAEAAAAGPAVQELLETTGIPIEHVWGFSQPAQQAGNISLLAFVAESVVLLCYTVAINFLAFTYFPRSSCAAYLLTPALPILVHSSVAEGIAMVV
jgi:hypothetical protein